MFNHLRTALVLSGILAGSPAFARDADGLADDLATPPPGRAQDLDLATKHFEDGVRLYLEGRYDLARIEFEAAFAVSRAADLLHNLSMVAERQGKVAEAIDFEQRFYDARRAELTEREADETQGRLVRLRAMLQAGASSAPAARAMTQPVPQVRSSRPPTGALALIGAVLGFCWAALAAGLAR